jgi:hypothetical protein
MYKKLLLIVLILSFSALAFALDDEGNPNDPNDNDRANACYEGGSMAGKCDTDWEWEAGWYLIRFEYGLISREDFPAQYAILLPRLAEDSNDTSSGVGCQLVPGGYVNFGNSNYVPASEPTYADANCTPPSTGTTGSVAFVWTNSMSSAAAICVSHGHPNSASTVTPGQLYHCN